MPRTRTLVMATAVLAALFTLVVTVLPFVSLGYRSVEAHIAIETAAIVTGTLAAILLYARVTELGRRSDVLLFTALLLFASTNLLFSVIPPIAGLERGGGFSTWAPVAGRFASAVMFAWAAFASDEPVGDARRAAARAPAVVLAGLALVTVVVAPLASELPRAVDPGLAPESGSQWLVGEPAVVAIQAVIAVLFGAAAFGFLRRAERTGDELSAWLAAAATLGAFARLNYMAFPSLYSEWVYTGDLLRLGFYVLLLVGAGREIIRGERGRADSLLFDERRRVAREIHDGLAQELAFIVTHAQRLGPPAAGRAGDQAALIRQLRDAAQRALDESRAAINVLTLPREESVGEAVSRAAEHVAERYGARVRFDLGEPFDTPRTVREAMVRIVREAAANAVRHGEARRVEVMLRGPHPVVLRITDDGGGFDPASAGSDGFGLTSMRERAEALGGSMSIESAPGAGTAVEVRLP